MPCQYQSLCHVKYLMALNFFFGLMNSFTLLQASPKMAAQTVVALGPLYDGHDRFDGFRRQGEMDHNCETGIKPMTSRTSGGRSIH